ncbi:LysR family transcriptional regulator [Amycolatopsis sp. PS_44_ISF1]|uniref:LysR family transcriptional regulator n=1 Tax=Amycolatopsis sp. PS_44_ISF1 TaxID=2974917 RepID=UPI0028DFF1CF|nr:LysR family transcriptional regulator [Amycolatopsis sp. PS_44_ISF1]MDT8912892.1 LysR family transcriptional regulator [Amycolatopsis sp. PS_44_ISF1]
MERRQLEYFLAVVDHGGFTNAARRLHVAQPSLSQAVRTLEKQLGGLLFHRLPHGAELTAAGTALVAPARQILRDLRTADAAVREVLGLGGGSLDIASQTTLAVDPLAALLGRFRAAHPKVRVRVRAPETGSDVVNRVRDGQSEVGLVESGSDTAGLAGVDLAEQEVFAVLPADSPRTGPLPRAELAGLDLVTTPWGTATRRLVEDALRGGGSGPRIVVETEHRAMMVPLVLAGAGAALLPRAMAEDARRQGAVIVPLLPRLVRRGRLVWRAGPLSPAAAEFIALVP